MTSNLHQGDWRDHTDKIPAWRDRPISIISDPPYSARTHEGQRSQDTINTEDSTITYSTITHALESAVFTLCEERIEQIDWVCLWCDHQCFAAWESLFSVSAHWLTFAPVVWVKTNAPPRFSSDGPACSCEYLFVARPRRELRLPGSRPGHYFVQSANASIVQGAKDLAGVRAVIRDYTDKQSLVVDLFAGSGTALLAAEMEGRDAIGFELDPETYRKASARLARGCQRSLI